MNASNKYKWELIPYFNVKDEDNSNLSSKHIYGKFLNYTEGEDFIGANLAKNILKLGGEKSLKFKSCYENACANESFLSLEDNFYNWDVLYRDK